MTSNRDLKHKIALLSTIFLLLAACGLTVDAQEILPGSVKGQVLDISTLQPVINANIVVIGTDHGAASDLDGNFRISGIAPGTFHIQASALGYKPETKSELHVSPSRVTTVEFQLESTVITSEEVVVKAGFFKPTPNLPISSRSLHYEEIRRAPGSVEDVQRAIQALPGVASANDQNNEIVVRGGSPFENLTLMDGVEIDNINHFGYQGGTGGPISAVNTDFLREVTFSSGGFSARFGDRVSSVLDLELKEGNRDRFTGDATLSMAGAGINIEGGMFDQRGCYMVSYRKSYLDLIKGPVGLTAVPHYWNSQFKAVYDLSSRNKLSLIGLYADDYISIESDEEDAWSRGAESVESGGFRYVVGARLRSIWSKGYSNIVIARSMADFSDDVYEMPENRQIYRNRSRETTDQLHITWTARIRRHDEWSAGISLKPIDFKHDMWYNGLDTTLYDLDNDGIGETTVVEPPWMIERSATSLKYAGFLQYRYSPLSNVTFIGGLRIDGFNYTAQTEIGPRLSVRWEFRPRMTLNLAYGQYYQSLPLTIYTWDPQDGNKELPFLRSDHYVLGINYLIRDATKISVEAFFKDYRNNFVAETDLVDDVTFQSWRYLSVGTKEAWGVEFFAQQKLLTNWYGTFSYSYGISEFSNSQETYPSNYDFRQVATLIAGYKFSGLPVRRFQKQWYGWWTKVLPVNGDELTASTRLRHVSGRPHTPKTWVDYDPSTHLDNMWKDGEINSDRYPDYYRWDVRWDSKWYFGSRAVVMFLEVENLLDRKNIAEYIYPDDPEDGKPKEANQFRFFFVGGVKFEW